jgi:hypothetical protein
MNDTTPAPNAIDTALIKGNRGCQFLEIHRPSKQDLKTASEAFKEASEILKASLVLLDHDCYTVTEAPQPPAPPLFKPDGAPTPAADVTVTVTQPEPAVKIAGTLGIIDVEMVTEAEAIEAEPFPGGNKTAQKKVFEERLATLEEIFCERLDLAGSTEPYGNQLKQFRPHRDAWIAAWKTDPKQAWTELLKAIAVANVTATEFTAWAPAA